MSASGIASEVIEDGFISKETRSLRSASKEEGKTDEGSTGWENEIRTKSPNPGTGNPGKRHEAVRRDLVTPTRVSFLGPQTSAAARREKAPGWLEGSWGTINGGSRTVDLGCRPATRVVRTAERCRPFLAGIGCG